MADKLDEINAILDEKYCEIVILQCQAENNENEIQEFKSNIKDKEAELEIARTNINLL